jgi:hypothetical protein
MANYNNNFNSSNLPDFYKNQIDILNLLKNVKEQQDKDTAERAQLQAQLEKIELQNELIISKEFNKNNIPITSSTDQLQESQPLSKISFDEIYLKYLNNSNKIESFFGPYTIFFVQKLK